CSVGSLAAGVSAGRPSVEAAEPGAPVGVCFSGGIDSGSVFLVVYHAMRRLGLSPARLKAFVLNLGAGPDLDQAREFLARLDLSLFLEEIEADPAELDLAEALRTVHDSKPLAVGRAGVGIA